MRNEDNLERLRNAMDSLPHSGFRDDNRGVLALCLIYLSYLHIKFNSATAQLKEAGNTSPVPEDYENLGVRYLPREANLTYLLSLPKNRKREIFGQAIASALSAALIPQGLIRIVLNLLQDTYWTRSSWIDPRRVTPILEYCSDLINHSDIAELREICDYLRGLQSPESLIEAEAAASSSIPKLMVAIIAPRQGRIFDPVCDYGDTFMCAADYVRKHGGNPLTELQLYGQASNPRHRLMCELNLEIHDFKRFMLFSGERNSVREELDKTMDFVLSNSSLPRMTLQGWEGVYRARVQEIYDALNTNGKAAFVDTELGFNYRPQMADIRNQLLKGDVIDAVVTFSYGKHGSIFAPEGSPSSETLCFLDKSRKQSGRGGRILLINVRDLTGQDADIIDQLSNKNIEFITNIVRLYRGEGPEFVYGSREMILSLFSELKYKDIAGLCRVLFVEEISVNKEVLDPTNYVGKAKPDSTYYFLVHHQPQLYVQSIRIRNYRSIIDATFEFNANCNVLIGQNNVGKSNVMKALDLILGSGDKIIYASDYFDPEESVVIELSVHGLKEQDPYFRARYAQAENVDDDYVTFIHKWLPVGRGAAPGLAVAMKNVSAKPKLREVQQLSEAVAPTPPPSGTTLRPIPQVPRVSRVVSPSAPLPTLRDASDTNLGTKGELYEKLHETLTFVYIPSSRGYDELGGGSSDSIFQRLLNNIIESDRNIWERVTNATETARLAMREAIEGLEFGGLRKQLQSGGLGFPVFGIDIEPKFGNKDILQYFKIMVDDGKRTAIEEKGFGLQNSIIITMFRLLATRRSQNVILCIEEPEIGLHSQSQRHLFRVLASIKGLNQVIFSTHSSNIATMWNVRDFTDNVLLLRRGPNGGTYAHQVTRKAELDTKDRKIISTQLRRAGGDILFATMVILVEGPTEAGALPSIAQRISADFDFDARGITVVDAGGWSSITSLIKLCKIMGIPYLAVFDRDVIRAYKEDYEYLSASKAEGKAKDSNKEEKLQAKLATERFDGAPMLNPNARDEIEGILNEHNNPPNEDQIMRINELLSSVGCYVLSSDFEKVFLQGVQEADQKAGRATNYRICYRAYADVYGDQRADDLEMSYGSNTSLVSKMLHEECKNELYWRILFSDESEDGIEWIAKEFKDIVEKRIFDGIGAGYSPDSSLVDAKDEENSRE